MGARRGAVGAGLRAGAHALGVRRGAVGRWAARRGPGCAQGRCRALGSARGALGSVQERRKGSKPMSHF